MSAGYDITRGHAGRTPQTPLMPSFSSAAPMTGKAADWPELKKPRGVGYICRFELIAKASVLSIASGLLGHPVLMKSA